MDVECKHAHWNCTQLHEHSNKPLLTCQEPCNAASHVDDVKQTVALTVDVSTTGGDVVDLTKTNSYII